MRNFFHNLPPLLYFQMKLERSVLGMDVECHLRVAIFSVFIDEFGCKTQKTPLVQWILYSPLNELLGRGRTKFSDR